MVSSSSLSTPVSGDLDVTFLRELEHPSEGWVWSVTFGTTTDGAPLLATGADDGTIRLWNPDTGDLVRTLTGHTGPVRSVTFGTTTDGAPLLATGADDRTIRLWNPDTGDLVANPLPHPANWVQTVAWGRVANRLVLAAAGGGPQILLWAVGPPFGPPPPNRLARATGDDEETDDTLGRQVLAGHLAGVLDQLAGRRGGTDKAAGTVVVSIDGRWGSGKSVLARLTKAELDRPAPDPASSPEPSPNPGIAVPEPPLVGEPILVWFDAWRESRVGPRWWSLGAALKRGIESERAGGARAAMTAVGAWNRVARSKSVIVAALAVVVATALALTGAWEGVSKVITAATALAALGLAIGRILFWSSPAIGRLYLTADSNPLEEVSGIVARLRRWSPRQGRRQRLADSLLTAWCLLVVGHTVSLVVTRVGAPAYTQRLATSWEQTWPTWTLPVAFGALIGLTAAFAIPPGRPDPPRPATRAWPPAYPPRWYPRDRVLVGLATTAAVVVGLRFLSTPDQWFGVYRAWGEWQLAHPLLAACLMIAVGVVVYAGWLARGVSQPRRPILLVLDDLDRCQAPDTVEYLETVHTLMRCRAEPRLFPRWRQPAPLLVLALADGRWIRTAFEEQYATFGQLGEPARKLGADFIQKLFDHTVLVPELTAEQAAAYLTVVTGSTDVPEYRELVVPERVDVAGAAAGSDGSPLEQADREVPEAGAVGSRSADAVAGADPAADSGADPELRESPRGDPSSPEPSTGSPTDAGTDAAVTPEERRRQDERAAERARVLASERSTKSRSAHLLTAYPSIMPGNPRLIRRVVNTWGMLEALKMHVRHPHGDDVLVRAAVVFVRFPSLVDELLDEHSPAVIADVLRPKYKGNWARPDVLAVLQLADSSYVEPRVIGECYGRRYASSV